LNAALEVFRSQEPGLEEEKLQGSGKATVHAELLVEEFGKELPNSDSAFGLFLATLRAILAWLRVVAIRAECLGDH
jgi:hypothetical protein